jgi:hypothetical protein
MLEQFRRGAGARPATKQTERFGGWGKVHWWIAIPVAAAIAISLYGLLRWASTGEGIDAEVAGEHFGDEHFGDQHEWQGLHRSRIDPVPTSHKRL